MEQQSRQREIEAQQSSIPDSALFSVAKKAGTTVKNQRDIIRRDRFNEKERLTTSKYEEELIKKIAKNKATQPPAQKKTVEEEFVDIWSNEVP